MGDSDDLEIPKVTYQDEKAFVMYIMDVLEERLAGRNVNRTVNLPPVDFCHLGVLAPWDRKVEIPLQDLEEIDEEPRAEVAESVSKEELKSPAQANKSVGEVAHTSTVTESLESNDSVRRPPSSLGCEILIQPCKQRVEFNVRIQFAIFTRCLPTYQEQSGRYEDRQVDMETEDETAQNLKLGMTLVETSVRHDVDVRIGPFTLKDGTSGRLTDVGKVQESIDAILAEAHRSPNMLRDWPGNRPKVPKEALISEDSFNEWLLDVTRGLPPVLMHLKARLEIRYQSPRDGTYRIGCYLQNQTPRSDQKRTLDQYHILGDARMQIEITAGELLPIEILPVAEDYQYDRRVWAVGHNTSVDVVDKRHIETRALARYYQVRRTTRNFPPVRFEDLADKPIQVLETVRQEMLSFAQDWERQQFGPESSLRENRETYEACNRDFQGFNDETRRFASGIAALRADARLLTAFRSMNRVMSRLAVGYDSWRLFQIVFIVTQLPALAFREGINTGEWPNEITHDWSDILDWADVLWFPTGGGKTEAYLGLVSCATLYDRLRGKSVGVTAWLRFPLRMLSLQQLQRAMRVIWETEQERCTLLGDKAKDSDPIQLGYLVGTTPNDLSKETFQRYLDSHDCEDLRVVPDCPACGATGAIEVHPDSLNLRFHHLCSNCGVELPLVVTDGEIYRMLPCLVVGTVDKMATVGFQPKFGLLWTGPRWYCPKHGYGIGKWCVWGCDIPESERRYVDPYDPSPTFHIQDELHLLQEELGAFAGHYETLIRYCEASTSGKSAKVVAATATIEGYEHQARHLYGVQGTRRFPGRGYDRHSTFYMDLDRDEDGEDKCNRVFLAFRASNMHPADASARCTQILLETIKDLQSNPYAGLAAVPSLTHPKQLSELLYYYSTTLNYVSNLPAGSRVKERLESHPHNDGRGGRDINVIYTSGRSTSGEVSEAVHRIEHPPQWSESGFLDSLVATNMISHGVDLERINLMVMDGFPEETAQYIQASSRSGRKHMGMVLVVVPSYSLRANSLYQRFHEYHDNLERMVSPVPVNRFAKYAIKRTLPGIVSGVIFGKYVSKKNRTDFNKRAIAYQLMQDDKADFFESLRGAYAITTNVYDSPLQTAFVENLELEFARLSYIIQSNELESRLTESMRPKPMLSLRDVERGIPFFPKNNDPRELIWFRNKQGD